MFSFDKLGSPLKKGLQRQPFEITVQMKREKLQALRSDFIRTREQGTTPMQLRQEGGTGTRIHTCNTYLHSNTHVT